MLSLTPLYSPDLFLLIDIVSLRSAGNVLGLGISGKVLGCTHIKSQDKCALKILKDTAKSRREVDLHWRASGCRHVVNIRDVYENTHNKEKCLMVVMEWSVSGSWMCGAFTSLN